MKALACELPATLGLPLSRFSRAELRRHMVAAGIVAAISGVTIWRWLHEDALRPWSRQSWIFPRDPQFAQKAGPVLDLYHRRGGLIENSDQIGPPGMIAREMIQHIDDGHHVPANATSPEKFR